MVPVFMEFTDKQGRERERDQTNKNTNNYLIMKEKSKAISEQKDLSNSGKKNRTQFTCNCRGCKILKKKKY